MGIGGVQLFVYSRKKLVIGRKVDGNREAAFGEKYTGFTLLIPIGLKGL